MKISCEVGTDDHHTNILFTSDTSKPSFITITIGDIQFNVESQELVAAVCTVDPSNDGDGDN